MKSLLDQIIWHTLSGAHSRFSVGTDDARRYAPGFSPIIAFADTKRPNFASLAGYCEPGERLHCDGWSGVAPEGWRIEVETSMFRMPWEGGKPAVDEAPDAVRIGPEHATQVLELLNHANPGPFGPRTIELGDYFGYFDGGRLIAMAGERFRVDSWREISGVCTHPDFQGRGFARRLMMKLVYLQLNRGEKPFLHVVSSNAVARRLYERMGFGYYKESPVRIVSRC